MHPAFSFYIKYGIAGSKALGMDQTQHKRNEPDETPGSSHE